MPPSRIVAAVLEQDSPWWQDALAELPPENVAEQPIDRGSASSILLAFVRLFRRDPSASIAILPARDVDTTLRREALREAFSALDHREGRALLLDAFGEGGSTVLASSATLLRLFLHAQPTLLETFLRGLKGTSLFDPGALDRIYPFLPSMDFELDILGKAPDLVRRPFFDLRHGLRATAA